MEDLDEDEKNEKEKQNSDLEGFRTWLKGVLGEKITRVEVRCFYFSVYSYLHV